MISVVEVSQWKGRKICLFGWWKDPKGLTSSGGSRGKPPLYFRWNWGPKDRKKNFWRLVAPPPPPPPPYLRVWMTDPTPYLKVRIRHWQVHFMSVKRPVNVLVLWFIHIFRTKVKIIASLLRENSSRDLRTELCTRVLELCSRSESWSWSRV